MIMRYLLAIYLDEIETAKRTGADIEAGMASHVPYIDALKRNAQLAGCDPLEPSATARTLRNAAGKVVPTVGPFAEGREQFGGYYVIEASDLDDAIRLAGQCPALRTPGVTGLEIRPVARAAAVEAAPSAASPRFFVAVYRNHDVADSPRPHANVLAPASSTTTLRWRDGKLVLSDGPIADREPELHAYWIMHARDVAAASELAAPHAGGDALEIRPIRPFGD
jgi:hypothetical protein